MRILCVGGGPAGLFLSILLKRRDPSHHVVVVEKNDADQTFGWGVVFSDETLGNFREAAPETYARLSAAFARWDDIDIHFRGEVIRSHGHGFVGVARMKLLRILQQDARALGVDLRFGQEWTDPAMFEGYDLVVAADGVRSGIRSRGAEVFQPSLDIRKCKYIWLGTTKRFDAFTFLFEETPHGVFQVHAYRFDEANSTFIVECQEEAWRRAGFDLMTPEAAAKALEKIFEKHLCGHKLLLNKSAWIQFATVKNARWRHGNQVLLGDAAHTAHFSIGSGTKLAMEDSIALADALGKHKDLQLALEAYEAERRPVVERTQKAAEDSLRWFESVPRYLHLPPLQFGFSLLTRSLRISYENLRVRDPDFVARVGADFQQRAEALAPAERERTPPRPPMFTPFQLRSMTVANRVVVSPMCMYSARDGLVDDFHLVHLGGRALGGAGLLITEMTGVAPDARITPGCAGLWREAHRDAWKRIVDFVHARSPARIGVQLGHAGRKGSTELPWISRNETTPLVEGGWQVVAPSAEPYQQGMQVPRAMDRDDMDRVIAQFAHSTRLAEQAGFDMVELHLAHGYLLSSFLSPLSNLRTDGYGGAIEQRMRFPLEVVEAVRATWPGTRPMSVRISATDWVPGGWEAEDSVVLARALRERGVDIVHVSTGQVSPRQKPIFGRMWQTRFSDQVRNESGLPTISVGNISTADQCNSILAAGRADLVALARPHLLDAAWTQRAAIEQDEQDALFWPKPYLSAKPRPGRREKP